MHHGSLAAVLATAIGMTACTSSGTAPADGGPAGMVTEIQATSARTNAEELRVFIDLPQETEDIVWREYMGGRKLVAVLLFSRADAETVAAQAQAAGPAASVRIPVEGWFPVELIAKGDASGDGTIPASAYPATTFLLSPYRSGTIARVENTDYFIIEAFTE